MCFRPSPIWGPKMLNAFSDRVLPDIEVHLVLQAGLEQRQHLSNTPILTDASDAVGTHTSSAGTHAPSKAPAEGSLDGAHSAGGRQEARPDGGSADTRDASTHGNNDDESDQGQSQQAIGMQGGGGFGAGGSQYTVQDFKENPKVCRCGCTCLARTYVGHLLYCQLKVGLLGTMCHPQSSPSETDLFLHSRQLAWSLTGLHFS